MSLTKEQVEHIAKLGRLALTDAETEQYSQDLNQILGYVETLQELNTDGVEPMTGALDLKHVTREDKAVKEIDKEEFLDNAPDVEGSAIKVPKMGK